MLEIFLELYWFWESIILGNINVEKMNLVGIYSGLNDVILVYCICISYILFIIFKS